jgi:hypothetical protein
MIWTLIKLHNEYVMERLNKKKLDNSEIIRLLKSESTLVAVKYVKDTTGWMLKECSEYVKNIRDNILGGIGTITWFRCEDQLPPPSNDPNKSRYSDELFLTDGKFIEKGHYCHSPLNENELPFWTSHYDPTHWAYINLP